MSKVLPLTDNEKDLLNYIQSKNTPTYRRAYSDRTAWLMACLSELAYQPFSRLDEDVTKQQLKEKLKTLLNEKTIGALDEVVQSVFEKDDAEAAKHFLKIADIKILKIYDKEGTQALLVSTQDYLVLAFRGTEATSLRDIKADVNAIITKCSSGGNIHSGFSEAFGLVEQQIQKDLEYFSNSKTHNKPLIVTGHSLGGALATIAAKRLQAYIKIATCYTFGSPRVGNDEWFEKTKTPVYRIVNAYDCVTILPPGKTTVSIFIFVFREVSEYIPFLRPFISFIVPKLEKFQGYRHNGDVRYLTACEDGNFADVKLLTRQVSLFERIYSWISSRCAVNRFVADHSISAYRKKLAVIARQRNSSDSSEK
ncbi:MAG: lipase family protein [Hyphomicrobiales bacterium]|nr:lipase family protein [Hyphomicrobiales bacterium]